MNKYAAVRGIAFLVLALLCGSGTAQEPPELYGIRIDMTVEEAVESLLARHPDSIVIASAPDVPDHWNVRIRMEAPQSPREAGNQGIIRFMPPKADFLRDLYPRLRGWHDCENRDRWRCAGKISFTIGLPGGEIRSLVMRFDYPSITAASTLVEATFGHNIAQDARFDSEEFMRHQYGDQEDEKSLTQESADSAAVADRFGRPALRANTSAWRHWASKDSPIGPFNISFRPDPPRNYSIRFSLDPEIRSQWRTENIEAAREAKIQREAAKPDGEGPFEGISIDH